MNLIAVWECFSREKSCSNDAIWLRNLIFLSSILTHFLPLLAQTEPTQIKGGGGGGNVYHHFFNKRLTALQKAMKKLD